MAPDRNRPPRAQSGRQFTAATYNVHSCVGLDRRCDPGRIAEVIGELDADVVALQEVDSRSRQRGRHVIDQFEYLAEATGLQAVPGQNIITHRGSFGNALLTRWPVTAVRRLDISVHRREPRGALCTEIAAGGHRLVVVATHLGLSLRERRGQVEALMTLVEAGLESRPDGLILLGDLNEWRRSGGTLAPLIDALRPVPTLATFPSWRPLLPLDRIFLGGRIRVHNAKAHRSRLARSASDHLPVRALLEWSARPRAEPEMAGSVAQGNERTSQRP